VDIKIIPIVRLRDDVAKLNTINPINEVDNPTIIILPLPYISEYFPIYGEIRRGKVKNKADSIPTVVLLFVITWICKGIREVAIPKSVD